MLTFIIYCSIAFMPIIVLPFKGRSSMNVQRMLLFVCFAYALFFTSIRYNVGSDFADYVSIYKNAESSHVELGFKWIIYFLNDIMQAHPQWLFVLIGAGCLFFVFRTYEHYNSLIIIIAWFFLFYLNSLNQIRQALAMCVILYAIKFIGTNTKKYYFYVFISTLFFHTIAVLAFVFPLFAKMNKKIIKLLYLAAPFFYFVSISAILTAISPYLGIYGNYLSLDMYSGKAGPLPLQIVLYNLAMKVFLPYVFLYFYRNDNSKEINLIKVALIFITIMYLLSLNFRILYRVGFIFEIIIPLALFYLYRKSKLITMFYVGLCFLYFLFEIYIGHINPVNANGINPYQTIFTENPLYINKPKEF